MFGLLHTPLLVGEGQRREGSSASFSGDFRQERIDNVRFWSGKEYE